MKPVLQALVVADRVYRDGQTGKSIIVGTFSQIVTGVPSVTKQTDDKGQESHFFHGGMQPGSPWAYICLTEVRGRLPLQIRLVDYQTHEAILAFGFEVECDNPLISLEYAIPLPMLPISNPGVYGIEVSCDDGIALGTWKINVIEYKQS